MSERECQCEYECSCLSDADIAARKAELSAAYRSGQQDMQRRAVEVAKSHKVQRLFEAGYLKDGEGRWAAGRSAVEVEQHNKLVHMSNEALTIASAISSLPIEDQT